MKIAIIFCCALFLTGCGRSTPSNFYLLESSLGPMQAEIAPGTTLRVAQVETPAYLARNNIVSRVAGETKLIVAEFHLWAEPVSSGARRVVEEILTEPMLKNNIYVLPSGTEEHGDYVLLIDIQRLDGNFNEKAVLEARWSLLNKDDKPLERGIFSAEEMVAGADYNKLVTAESSLLKKFGQHLAQRLPALTSRKAG